MKIDKTTSLRMRGIGILLICLHNLLHLDSGVLECEFEFTQERVGALFTGLREGLGACVEACFSFWGWYGVSVFLFLSGYGLVCKYELGKHPLRPWGYLRNHYKKLLLLLFPAYLFFVLNYLPKGIISPSDIIGQLTLTLNLYDARAITPGVYWYFGVTMQLYIVYLLFHYKRSDRLLLILTALSIVIGVYFAYAEHLSEIHYQLRHNFPLWLSVFTLGIWTARHGSTRFIRLIDSHWVASLLVLLSLWLLSSVWTPLWVLSPLFMVAGILLLVRHCHFRSLTWIGRVSAGVFVCHPILRMFALKGFDMGMNLLFVCVVYIALSLLAGWLYMRLIERIR